MQEKFIELFKETLDIEDREIQLSDKFREYEEWNSLAYLSVIAMLDEEYEVIIEGAAFKELRTLDELYKEIQVRSVL
ncbi:MAG: acyl carrier protein [Mariniphaga sp.]|nr:acyl carrier protein [Mariniphaga sp.]